MDSPNNFTELVAIFTNLIWRTLPVLMGLAFLVFVWGLAKFIGKAGDAKSHEEGKNLMKWGIIALFIMLSFWGILEFFYRDFGFQRPFGFPLLPTRSIERGAELPSLPVMQCSDGKGGTFNC